jgi:hypothetical protein
MMEQLLGYVITTSVGIILGYIFKRMFARTESEAEKAHAERVAARNERDLMRRVSKMTVRVQLVQMHSQFMRDGAIDDSQRVSYADLDKIYHELCLLTNDTNGVIDKYYTDVNGPT